MPAAARVPPAQVSKMPPASAGPRLTIPAGTLVQLPLAMHQMSPTFAALQNALTSMCGAFARLRLDFDLTGRKLTIRTAG